MDLFFTFNTTRVSKFLVHVWCMVLNANLELPSPREKRIIEYYCRYNLLLPLKSLLFHFQSNYQTIQCDVHNQSVKYSGDILLVIFWFYRTKPQNISLRNIFFFFLLIGISTFFFSRAGSTSGATYLVTVARVYGWCCLVSSNTKFQKFHRIPKIPKREHVSDHSEQLWFLDPPPTPGKGNLR